MNISEYSIVSSPDGQHAEIQRSNGRPLTFQEAESLLTCATNTQIAIDAWRRLGRDLLVHLAPFFAMMPADLRAAKVYMVQLSGDEAVQAVAALSAFRGVCFLNESEEGAA